MTDDLITAVYTAADWLELHGIQQDAIKRRDRREPGRRRKEEAEQRLAYAMRRYWRGQAARIRARMEAYYPDRKSIKSGLYDDLGNDQDEARILMELMRAAMDGVALFGELTKIGLDYTLVHVEESRWAREYGYTLIRDINETTLKMLREVVSGFIETPGMTIGNLVSMLPYSQQRALTIGVTEITRAYATSTEIAGKQLQREFPDVQVIKTWWTNNDDRVCLLCGPFNGIPVLIGEGFTTDGDKSLGVPYPPIHPNCRCWISTTTRINTEGIE